MKSQVPGVNISMTKLPMLAITERVDISILHEHNWEANIIVNERIILLQNSAPFQMFSSTVLKTKCKPNKQNCAPKELTWMVETAADLHGTKFTVEPHRPWGVGGDFAGILFSTLTATVYKAKW